MGLATIALARAQVGDAGASSSSGWVSVDYGPIVDRRVPTHSGESVGTILDRLDGRTAPDPGQRPADARDHALVHPLLEPYAHVLPDAVDTLEGPPERPWFEIGWLWEPGEAAPAWVELLRARRAVVESDGAGRVRVFAPLPGYAEEAQESERSPGERAWRAERAWLRHALAAERERLAEQSEDEPSLQIEVYAYRHRQARTRFELHLEPHRVQGDPLAPPGDAPPLDLVALESFLGQGLELEGGRLEDGTLRLIGSDGGQAPTLLGEPLSLADLAVAYRAVVRGGRARPYMSLDRGFAPHRSLVTYGGRLADTRLGMVSLLCDVRFKTFSQGIDPHAGEDVRKVVRERVPGFRTHIERYAAHPQRGSGGGQQTRLWFYPDDVRMLVDPEARMLALTRPRMTAAAERVELGASAPDDSQPPWTRALTAQLNEDYDELAGVFPELADLDRTVRLLGLFSWLDFAAAEGRAVPDLDALLAVELPALRTPRRFPQLLALDGFPARPGDGPVDVFPRRDVSAALDRLMPAGGGMLVPRARLFRALAALDRGNPAHAALLERISGLSPDQLAPADVDALAYQAERLRMHELVVGTLAGEQRARLREREAGGESIDVLSVAVGGLDLGLGRAVERGAGAGQPLGLGAGAVVRTASFSVAGGNEGPGESAPAVEPSADWKTESPGLPRASLPSFGEQGESRRVRQWVREDEAGREVAVVHLPRSPDVRARTLLYGPEGGVPKIVRVDGGHRAAYRLEGDSRGLTARPATAAPVGPSPVADRLAGDPPQGLATLSSSRAGRAVADSTGSTLVRLHARRHGTQPRAVDVPRPAFQGLILGPRLASRSALRILGEIRELTGFRTPSAGTVMLMEDMARLGAPWEVETAPRPGEEHPARVARAVTRAAARNGDGALRGVVGIDPEASLQRWRQAARSLAGTVLWLPPEAFPGRSAALRDRLSEAWPSGRVVEDPGALETLPGLVVLASAEPPGRLIHRVRELAEDPRVEGRHLAVFALAGKLRWDVVADTLAESQLGGLGVAGTEPLAWQGVAEHVGRLAASLDRAGEEPLRPERLDGPFVWVY
jgi:hypothetical protein